MKIFKKYYIYALSLCMAAFMMVMPIRAEAAYGDIVSYTPTFNVLSNDTRLIMTNTYTGIYDNNSSTIESRYVNASYEGALYLNPQITFQKNNFYTGSFFFDVVIRSDQSSNLYFNAKYESKDIENINVSMELNHQEPNYSIYRVVVEFMNYYASNNMFRVPINITASTTLTWDASLQDIPVELYCYVTSGNVNNLGFTRYSDIRDVPSVDGINANQNQQIINRIESNTTAVNQHDSNVRTWFSELNNKLNILFSDLKNSLISSIQTEFSNLTNNMQGWYTGICRTINDAAELIMSGYQGTGTTEATNKFDTSSGELESVESDLTSITNSSIGSYTDTAFDTSVIASLGSSLVYVVTWFTNFWNMGGLFTSILNVGLALSVAFFILRLRGGS